MRPGDRLEALMPRGGFRLDTESPRPAVLLSAGVGVTPMVSMLAALAAADSGRETWFLHGTRNGAEHAFADEVRRLAESCTATRVHIAYSQPGAGDAAGRHYDAAGRLTVDRVRDLLPDNERDFYICGPVGFMRDLYRGLREWGVPKERIHHEFFGVAEAFEGDAKPPARPAPAAPASGEEARTVTFARSGVRATWTPAEGSLLELAEANGINPPFSCRDGECLACLQVVLDGEVQYWRRGDDPREPGCELLCCSFPKTDVTIDI
jgi:ferredoxin-NADP reductase